MILCVITLIAGVCLSGVHEMTADIIAEQQAAAKLAKEAQERAEYAAKLARQAQVSADNAKAAADATQAKHFQ